ncbi:MAG: tetratricopeptide repeat-containing sensor histidine kinase, partial [Lutibacter sp.]
STIIKLKILITILLFSFTFCFAQNSQYVDSIEKRIIHLPEKEQLKSIITIPYDKFIGNLKTSERLAMKAISIAEELDDRNSLAEAYMQLGQVYAYLDNREKKLSTRLKAIHIFESIDSISKAAYAYGELGYSMRRTDLKSAIFYMRNGLKLLLKEQSKVNKNDAIYDNYGILKGMTKDYDSAIYFHKKSLYLKKLHHDSIGIPFSYVHLATVNIALKNFYLAKKYIDSSHFIRKKRKDTYGLTDNMLYYGDLYYAQNKFKKATDYFLKGFKLASNNEYIVLKRYSAKYLALSFAELENFKSAYKYKDIYQKLKDSAVNESTNSKVEELKIKYDTQKKEKEIAQQRQELLLKEIQLKNKNIYTLTFLFSSLILGIIIFGLFKRHKHKQREFLNQLKLQKTQNYAKLQDQRLRISRDLHDNIGSQLTFIISSINNLKYVIKKPNSKIEKKLNEITQFTTGTINELRDTIWAMNKNQITKDEFLARVMNFISKAKSSYPNVTIKSKFNMTSNFSFSSVVGIHLFRIIQEAVNNALKYSFSEQINLNFYEDNQDLIFEIIDHGKGFKQTNEKLGNGLLNMEKRATEIQAKLIIQSELNNGAQIKIGFPKDKL